MIIDALQHAVYDRLTAVSAVSGAVIGIYTKAPQDPESEDNTAFPFITIGPIMANPSDTKDSDGIMALVDVHVWSRSQSALSWRGIGTDIYAAMQKHALTVTGANVVDCRFDSEVDYQDPTDGRTWHMVLTFRVYYFIA